jgi:heptosyltransferase-2
MRSLTELNPARVLVVAPSWVGDVVMATAALRCLRLGLPEARISVLARSWLADVLEASPRIDELIRCNPKGAHRGLLGHLRLKRELHTKGFDAAISLPHSFHAALLGRLSGAPVRIGYNRGERGLLLTDWIAPPREGDSWLPVPKTTYYLDLLRAAGLECESTELELFCTDEDRRFVEPLLDEAGVSVGVRLVLINPGANFGSSKCWLPERFAEVADALHEEGAVRVGIVCGPGEEPIVDEILERAQTQPFHLARQRLPLGPLKALVDRCDMMITNDTGPRHFAVAFDKPCVVIMGSTDPRHTAANLGKTVVVRKDVECGPCHKRSCPTDHVCMTSITTADVLGAAESLIAQHWQAT